MRPEMGLWAAYAAILLAILAYLAALREELRRFFARWPQDDAENGGAKPAERIFARKRRAKRFTDRSGAWIDAREGRRREK